MNVKKNECQVIFYAFYLAIQKILRIFTKNFLKRYAI